ncbi:hypothetical protein [Streptomyces sp. CA-253872]|uniref:hypothetical protein n=1 Tax=Streptomyces sp. CA-253872 TaxID=3240067 RepID=UPI003D8E9265
MPKTPAANTTPDKINVRVTLSSYDLLDPAEKQTQVYVDIPSVARATWLLDADFHAVLKHEPWPAVIDCAHAEYERRGVVSDPTSAAARQAIVDWLLLSEGAEFETRHGAVYAAWEADQARRHPVARKLLAENERLRAELAKRAPRAETDTTEIARLRAELAAARALAADATRYEVPLPENGGTEVRLMRSTAGGWTAVIPRRGGGVAWTKEGWQEAISALSVDRLFCWPSAETALTETRKAITPDAHPAAAPLASDHAAHEAAPDDHPESAGDTPRDSGDRGDRDTPRGDTASPLPEDAARFTVSPTGQERPLTSAVPPRSPHGDKGDNTGASGDNAATVSPVIARRRQVRTAINNAFGLRSERPHPAAQ